MALPDSSKIVTVGVAIRSEISWVQMLTPVMPMGSRSAAAVVAI